jgi:hypothetical protein
MIIDTWETGQGGNAEKKNTAAENSGNSRNIWRQLGGILGLDI